MSGLTAATTTLKFRGPNWEDLNRLVALAKFQFLVDNDFWILTEDNKRVVPAEDRRCAYLAAQFEGAALDWVASHHSTNALAFASFSDFVGDTRAAFGIADDNVKALCQSKLNDLPWGTDVPTFFSELDRLFLALGITGHDARIAYAMGKLPTDLRKSLADQGRQFHNYETMREWLNTRWALMPSGNKSSTASKPRCGSCGKKGHAASSCRSSKN